MSDPAASESPPTSDPPASVAFHFDLMCPYAYQTSLWMRELRWITIQNETP